MDSELHTISLSDDFDTVKLRVWHGAVRVKFCLNEESLFLDVPRMTYFPVAASKLIEYFDLDQEADVQLSSPIFTSGREDRVPLACHLPVGLLYDLYAQIGTTWVVHVAFLPPSADKTLPAQGSLISLENLRFVMWNSLKENEFLRRHTIRRVQNLTPSEAQDLCQSMLKLSFVEYARQGKTLLDTEDMRFLPVRLYLTGKDSIQDLIPTRIEGERCTIKHALQKLVPDIASLGTDMVDIILHGVVVDWNLGLKDLLEECAYVDGWLYLTVRLNPARNTKLLRGQESRNPMHTISTHVFTDQFT